MNRKKWNKVLFLIILAVMPAVMSACSGKETVLLEAGDLVREQEQAGMEEDFPIAMEEGKEQVEKSTLFVHICGEVKKPGVYELPKGSRIYEAVQEAGGFTEDAAADYVNLAYVLEDGWKIEIPPEESLAEGQREEKEEIGEKAKVSPGMERSAVYGVQEGAFAKTAEETDDGLVDINTAEKEELQTIPGVGENRAESIIAYRERNGGFSRIEDIMKVEGIKEGMFAKMKDKICVRGVR